MVSLLRVPLFKSEELLSLSLFPPQPHPVRLLYPWNFPKLVSSASVDRFFTTSATWERASLVAHMAKNLPAMQEPQV